MPKIFRAYVNHQRAVGNAAVALVHTHAVNNNAAGFAGCANHLPARAHAKRIRRARAFRVMPNNGIICRAELRMPGKFAILRAVNQFLRVFNAHTNGKSLGFGRNFIFCQHGISVTGAVPACQNNSRCVNFFTGLRYYAFYCVIFNNKTGSARIKAYFAAQACYHFV